MVLRCRVNARAIDFARFGVLFLNGGSWGGQQVIPRAWVEESTAPWEPDSYDAYYPESFASVPGIVESTLIDENLYRSPSSIVKVT